MSDPCFWVIVPTHNPGPAAWLKWLQALQNQNCKPMQVVVVDSDSSDGTPELSLQAGHTLLRIQARDFNHGATRQWALDHVLKSAKDMGATLPEFVVYLTQDAILASPQSLRELLDSFQDPLVAAAFGRQLPMPNASWLEWLARTFNYPDQARTVNLQHKAQLGIKTCFLSNSFAAYRLQSLQQQGGFPANLPLGEDTYLAAKFLIASQCIRYQARAQVYHSHQYNAQQDFSRMFDTGVFHQQNPWLLQTFGQAEGEGLQLVLFQLRFLLKLDKHHEAIQPPSLLRGVFQMFISNTAKLAGYKAGLLNHYLPLSIKRAFAMNINFWAKQQ